MSQIDQVVADIIRRVTSLEQKIARVMTYPAYATAGGGGGGSTTVSAGDGIEVTGDPTAGYTVAADIGAGLEFSGGAIQAHLGTGLAFDVDGSIKATGGGGGGTWDDMPARVKRGVRIAIYTSSFS